MQGLLVGNTEVRTIIDFNKRILHILDLDNEGRMSVTNGINDKWQNELVNILNYKDDLKTYRWFICHTNGDVSNYADGTFININIETNEELHPPFVPIMYKRANDFYLN